MLVRVFEALDEAGARGSPVDLGLLARELGAPEAVVRRCAAGIGALATLEAPAQATSSADALANDLTPRFELLGPLGRGGFAVVYRARERAAGREVALKVLHAHQSASGALRFLREATATASLDHPGIVKVHAVGTYSGRPCIVYELVDGRPLAEALPALAPRARVELVRDAARAIGHAHARGVVHRDVKPDNLLLDRDGRVRVADFGLALIEGAQRLTGSGAFVGTPTHMAPEQFAVDRTSFGPQLDVWALGVVLYEALTGELPFKGATILTLAVAVNDTTPIAPRSIDGTIDRQFEKVCLRALERDRARRYAHADALADDLDAALAGRPLAPVPVNIRPRRAALVAAGGAGCALLVGLVVVSGRDAPPPPPPFPSLAATAAAPTSATPDRGRRLASRARCPCWAVWVDERRVLVGALDEHLRLWDAVDGSELRRWNLLTTRGVAAGPGRALVLDRDGRLLRIDADSSVVETWDVSERTGSGARTTWLAATLGGARVALSLETAVRVLDLSRAYPLLQCSAGIECLAFSPDGGTLAIATADQRANFGGAGPILLWDVDLSEGGWRLRRPIDAGAVIRCLTFSPDGRALFAGSKERVVHIDLATGEVTRHSSHTGPVNGLVVSPDARRLFSAGDQDGTTAVRVWELPSGAEQATPAPLRGGGRGLALSPSGALVAVCTEGAGVHVLPAP